MALNVMVVDDSAVIRARIIRAFHLGGPPIREIHQAGNGQEALEALARNWIDLLLVDINMPAVDGIELIARIRKMPEITDLPAIVVSTESSSRLSMLQKEGARFVHKPFSAEILRATVVEMTGGYAAVSGQ
jgi:CheY-like chemotaxis protein